MSDAATPSAGEPSALRARGLERMGEVYNFEVNDGPGDFFGYTVEHLFGDIWEREGLSLRDRRLLLIGLMVAEGLDGTLGIQLDSCLDKGDLSADDLREVVIFLTHYAGWHAAFLLLAGAACIITLACLVWLPETRSQDIQARSFAVLWRESRALLAHSLFMGYVLQVALIYALFFVFVSLTPYVMVKTLGLSADRFGLYYLFLAGGFLILLRTPYPADNPKA